MANGIAKRTGAVWAREEEGGESTLSRRAYMAILSLSTLGGVLLAAFVSALARDIVIESIWANIALIVCVLLACFVGISITAATKNPAVALLGHAIVVVAIGVLLGPLVGTTDAALLMKAFGLAAVIVAGLGILGVALPKDLAGWGLPLFGALWVLIVCLVVTIIAGVFGFPIVVAMKALYWIILILFSLMVVYDFNRAVRLPHTAVNAIAVSTSIFLDYVNIALALVGIGRD